MSHPVMLPARRLKTQKFMPIIKKTVIMHPVEEALETSINNLLTLIRSQFSTVKLIESKLYPFHNVASQRFSNKRIGSIH